MVCVACGVGELLIYAPPAWKLLTASAVAHAPMSPQTRRGRSCRLHVHRAPPAARRPPCRGASVRLRHAEWAPLPRCSSARVSCTSTALPPPLLRPPMVAPPCDSFAPSRRCRRARSTTTTTSPPPPPPPPLPPQLVRMPQLGAGAGARGPPSVVVLCWPPTFVSAWRGRTHCGRPPPIPDEASRAPPSIPAVRARRRRWRR